MLTASDVNNMKQRKIAALNALKFFTDIKDIKSSNTQGFNYPIENDIIGAYRKQRPRSIMGSFADAAKTGAGNCAELSAIVYASLFGNPRIIDNSMVAICHLEVDHTIVLVTDKYAPLSIIGWNNFNKFSQTTMVVDPWTRDCYFPNLDPILAYAYSLDTIPLLTPWQIEIRKWCKTSKFRFYHKTPILPPKESGIYGQGCNMVVL